MLVTEVSCSKATRSRNSMTMMVLRNTIAVSFTVNVKHELCLWRARLRGRKKSRCVKPDDGVRLKSWRRNTLKQVTELEHVTPFKKTDSQSIMITLIP